MELVARSAGTLLKHLVAAGATVPVSAPMGWIGQAGESVDGGSPAAKASTVNGERSTGTAAPSAPSAPPVAAPSQPSSRPAVQPSAPPPPVTLSEAKGPISAERIKASPLARKIAGERGLDLGAVAGSGPEGRIVKRDLDTVSGERSAVSGRTPAGPLTAHPAPLTAFTDTPLSQIRKTIAKRLVQSIGPIPT